MSKKFFNFNFFTHRPAGGRLKNQYTYSYDNLIAYTITKKVYAYILAILCYAAHKRTYLILSSLIARPPYCLEASLIRPFPILYLSVRYPLLFHTLSIPFSILSWFSAEVIHNMSEYIEYTLVYVF